MDVADGFFLTPVSTWGGFFDIFVNTLTLFSLLVCLRLRVTSEFIFYGVFYACYLLP